MDGRKKQRVERVRVEVHLTPTERDHLDWLCDYLGLDRTMYFKHQVRKGYFYYLSKSRREKSDHFLEKILNQ